MNNLESTSFTLEGEPKLLDYIETVQVKDGVTCDIYTFKEDTNCDIAKIIVNKGVSTPLQKVLEGTKTIEGYISGKGILRVTDESGLVTNHIFPNSQSKTEVIIEVGQIMQWTASIDSDLSFYEICYPPYRDGRFEDQTSKLPTY